MTSVQTLELQRALNETHIAPKHKKRDPKVSFLTFLAPLYLFLRFIGTCCWVFGVFPPTLISLFRYGFYIITTRERFSDWHYLSSNSLITLSEIASRSVTCFMFSIECIISAMCFTNIRFLTSCTKMQEHFLNLIEPHQETLVLVLIVSLEVS